MAFRPLFTMLLFALLLVGSPMAWARILTDATQTRVTIVDQPKRVITLLPSIAELAADLLGPENPSLVGVSEFTDFPPALKKLPKVGSFQRLNLEAIVGLHPDLVLASLDGNSKDQVNHLRELGIPVVVVATDSFQRIQESMRLVGMAMGAPANGERMAHRFEKGLEGFAQRARARNRSPGTPPRKVLIEVGNAPLIVAGKKSFLNDAIEAIGAVNLYADLPGTYPRPSFEDALARDPDEIVILALSINEKILQSMLQEWMGFPTLRAVRKQRIHVLREDSIARPSLRLLDGLALLEKAVYESP